MVLSLMFDTSGHHPEMTPPPPFSVQESAAQDVAESLVEDFVVTESAEAVEVAIAESAVQPVRVESLVS